MTWAMLGRVSASLHQQRSTRSQSWSDISKSLSAAIGRSGRVPKITCRLGAEPRPNGVRNVCICMGMIDGKRSMDRHAPTDLPPSRESRTSRCPSPWSGGSHTQHAQNSADIGAPAPPIWNSSHSGPWRATLPRWRTLRIQNLRGGRCPRRQPGHSPMSGRQPW